MIRAVLSEPKSLISTWKQYGRNLSTTSKKIIFRIIFVKTKHWKIMTKRRKKRIMKQKLFHVNELSKEILEFDWVARSFSFFVLYSFSCVNLSQRVVTSTFQQFIVIFQVFYLMCIMFFTMEICKGVNTVLLNYDLWIEFLSETMKPFCTLFFHVTQEGSLQRLSLLNCTKNFTIIRRK